MQHLSLFNIIKPNDEWDDELALRQVFTGGAEQYQGEKRCICKDGSIVWVLLNANAAGKHGEVPEYVVCQVTDSTERKRIASELQKASNDLNSLFNTEIPASIIGIGLTGTITHFSKGAEMLLGYKAEELVNRSTPAVFQDHTEVAARAKELSAILGRDIHGLDTFVTLPGQNGHESREWTFVRKDGKRIPVQLVISTTKDEHGAITGYLGIATDNTERREAEEIRRNIAILQSRNKEMEEFTYIASHDLQEPLRTVTSFLDLLHAEYSSQLAGDGMEYLAYISASTQRMSELIKGLLDFSRIGKKKELEIVDCQVVLRQATDDLAMAVKESGAVITSDPLPVIKGFGSEMKQLFQNLLSNALKFRKANEAPQIHISAKQIPGFWQFEVRDNGIGIDPKHFQKIFILFQRLHGRKDFSGTGIGLSYCKKIVELHHGKIWVESALGEGSNFIFTISNHNA
jgi:PAS domain S-box-containing protein